jgi:hypothetical protein
MPGIGTDRPWGDDLQVGRIEAIPNAAGHGCKDQVFASLLVPLGLRLLLW